MAPSIKKYIYIIFLVSPIALSLHAQSKSETTTVSNDLECTATAFNSNQKIEIADTACISKLDNSNQFIAGLSIPKGSLAMAADGKNQTLECQEESLITGSYSVLAKDIIENYKYDFSETFIDILFFENIDLARKRTI
ncbi:hypothetical protein IRZ83_06145 [Flavobacterium sp. JLP]|uniref:hypothetical protein n=1 Tax=unclassified Flavobacterium TaxID=196869 RepID=UPI000493575C|nr:MULTISPECIES: hypothetical protein [unclassified Flavobacterium]MBF4492475.1 hypothetical protein [Flavobacterium sp. MR2016-29]MBF4506246.1 hypothetical protein [Flavobacterium sp. JLP]